MSLKHEMLMNYVNNKQIYCNSTPDRDLTLIKNMLSKKKLESHYNLSWRVPDLILK